MTKSTFFKIIFIFLLIVAGYILNNIRSRYKEFTLYKELENINSDLYIYILIKNSINYFHYNNQAKIKSMEDFYKCIEIDTLLYNWFSKYNLSIEINDEFINLYVRIPNSSIFDDFFYKRLNSSNIKKIGDYYLLGSFSNDYSYNDTLVFENPNHLTHFQKDSLKISIAQIRKSLTKNFSRKYPNYYFFKTSPMIFSSLEKETQLYLRYDSLSNSYKNDIIYSIDYIGEEYLLSLKMRLDSILKNNGVIFMRYTLPFPYYSPIPPP
jgi:hypothetical protein